MRLMTAVIVFWAICAILSYGITLNTFTNQFPYMKHQGFATGYSVIGGPVALIVSVIESIDEPGGIGLRFKPMTYDQRLQYFLKDNAILGKEYFDENYR